MRSKIYLLIILFIAISIQGRDREFEKRYSRVNLGKPKPIAEASSFLMEPGKKKDLYHAKKLVDGSLSSSWCTSKNKGIGEILYIPFNSTFTESYIYSKKNHTITIRISNGYGGSVELFQKNNRAKQMTLEIYELAFTDTLDIGVETVPNYPRKILEGPILNSKHEIEFEDDPSSRDIDIPIELKIMPKERINKFASPDLFLKFTILEIYPGSKYNDLCIAEMAVYGESITLPTPLRSGN
ncbi:hypothetical protein EHQ23_08125 [Leptospira bourretii]|uniref:NAD glycohydrolase translocation F5/8 type C domain-containing protein n=1 Tax=Leptospira bourretii TaxID=2484962 RepID=A0A4R9IUL3_9LEPT|nr:hypothetical protein [Leptospira bourretii]TGK86214.1 hypothetical protein EHQ23_08125 [Leptospira bourretii]TGK94975.1 hypothetical protein EHQ26_00055 [Leptospira bourretii]TGL42475.1 hypothetical protein EHQ45_02400 [Leptospira bourretii]